MITHHHISAGLGMSLALRACGEDIESPSMKWLSTDDHFMSTICGFDAVGFGSNE